MSPNPLSLKALVLRGSSWTIVGHASATLIRLASSLVLTRLLVPEIYGVMSLVWMVMYGLVMLSDVGSASAIIRDQRGDDPEFLNTAWTVQVIRGAVLWAGSYLAAEPMAVFYGQPELAQLIPVAGLTAIIGGFGSTALFTCRRHMNFKSLTLLELSTQAVGFVVTVLWALVYPTAWAIVGGMLISTLFTTLASHAFLPGIRNGFRLEIASLRVLVGFGKWVFLSSMFFFLAGQGDRMLLGYYLDIAQLGVYSIAVMLSEAVYAVVLKLTHGVLFPAYSNIVQTEMPRLRSVIDKARIGIDILLIIPIALLMMIGSQVVELLYDVRYREAGWMLQILCVRLLMTPALSNSEACLIALGYPKYAFFKNFFRAIWIVLGIPVGWSLAGITGVVWAVALSELPVVVVLWGGLVRHHVFSPRIELRTLIFTGVGTSLGFGLSKLLQ